MPTDTRSAVAEAIKTLSAEPADTSTATEPVEHAGDVGGEVDTQAAPDPEPSSAGASRDAAGRFAKGAKEPAGQAKPGTPADPADAGQGAAPQGSPPAGAVPALPKLNAPQDWRAAAKAKWDLTPREAQEEALRLHVETKKTLDRAAALERDLEPWRAATQPYGHLFNGAPPHQVIGNLLRSLSVLQTGHPQQRAQVAASIVRDYLGTDEGALTLLAQALDASGTGKPAPQPRALSEADIEQMLARREQVSQQTAAVKTWKDFETANPEFLNEPGFRQRIAIELQVAMDAKGGLPTKDDLQAAYDAACQTHPGVAKITNQRKEAERVKAQQASTSAAAASGVKNEPAGPSNGAGPAKDTREEVARLMKRARQARV